MPLPTSNAPAGRAPGEVSTPPLVSATTSQWPVLAALGLLAMAALVIGWPWLSGRVTIPWDAKAGFLPQIQFLAQSLAGGQSPFWAPYAFSGHPQVADPQSMIFSPPFLLSPSSARRRAGGPPMPRCWPWCFSAARR